MRAAGSRGPGVTGRGATAGRASRKRTPGVLALALLLLGVVGADAAVVTYQRGDGKGAVSETDDTTLDFDNPNTPWIFPPLNMAITQAEVDNLPERHTIIKYPNIIGLAANQIPPTSFIISATLTVILEDDGAGGTDCPSVYQLTEDWVEGEATWNDRSSGVPWSSPGADGPGSHDGVRLGYFPCTGAIGPVNMDVTSSVQSWSNGDLNAGWVLTNSTGSNNGIIYQTSEHIQSARPILTVEYGSVTDFDLFRNITVDRTKIPGTCGATLTDYPMLFSVTNVPDLAHTGSGGAVTDLEGDDIIFRAADDATCGGVGTAPCVLDHEVEKYVPGTGELVAWVRIPSVRTSNGANTSNTVIQILYGNPGVTTSTQNAAGVWRSDFECVYHLEESVVDEGSVADAHEDSTANDNHGDQGGNVTATGKIAEGQDFDAANDSIVGTTTGFITSAGTVETWIKTNWNGTDGGTHDFYSELVTAWDRDAMKLKKDGGGNEFQFYVADSTAGRYRLETIFSPPQVWNAGEWHHMVGVWDAAFNVLLYIDGVEVGNRWDSAPSPQLPSAIASTFALGGLPFPVDGVLDEFRMSRVARSACWIAATYENTDHPGDLGDPWFYFLDPPTAVELHSFVATAADGAVALTWRTGSELDNLGFQVHRSSEEDGPWTQVTPALIPGLGSSPEGAWYSWTDAGLSNGTRYYYRLEDVDTASRSTFHGPVSAVPRLSPIGGEGGGGPVGTPLPEPGLPGPAPEPPAPAPVEGESPSPLETECPAEGPCLFGDPGVPSLRVVSRSTGEVTVELVTPGFSAEADAEGLRASLSGFASPTEPGAVDLPFKRTLLDGVVGRRARLVAVEASSELSWLDLRPAAVGRPSIDARPDGTVRAARGRVPLGSSVATVPRARLAGDAFMGRAKKIALELHPLRWDPARERLVLARVLRVRIAFAGDAPGESGNGSIGRRNPRPRTSAAPVFAHLHTTERGLHAVAWEEIFPSPRRALPVSALRLLQGGRVVPVHVEPPSGLFGPGSVLYFHADREASSTDYSGEVSFALERAGGGAAMPLGDVVPLGVPVASAPFERARFETNRIYQSGLLEAPDIWLWEFVPGGVTRTVSLSLHGVDASSTLPVRVRLFLQGGSDAARPGEHHLSATLNGVSLGETRFAGKRSHVFEGTLSASDLLEGPQALSLTNIGDTGVVSGVFLDRVEIDYPRIPALDAGRFRGEWTEDGVARVGLGTGPDLSSDEPTPWSGIAPRGSSTGEARGPRGSRSAVTLPGAAVALDVTDPGAPVWLSGLEAEAGAVRLQAEAGRRYAIVSPEGLLSPRVSLPRGTGLRDARHQADYILVAPERFLDAAQPLLLRREGQGLATFAASLEDIASEFGGGAPSAEAIRDFLSHAFHSWQPPAPRYVLLLGDASFDPRNFTGADRGAPLPALWAKTSYLWTATDPALAAVNGEDLLPDLALGRLPATNLLEAEALVQKVLDWEDGGHDLAGAATLVADDPDQAGDFEADIADISQLLLASRHPRALHVRELGAFTRPAILDAMSSGLSLLSYVGHGGPSVWASENVLNSFDPPALLAQPRQPLMLTMNCLNGYFVSPSLDSLAEAFLKVEGRGSIAAFSPSGLSLDGPAHAFHRAVVDQIANGDHATLGDAILAAQQAYASSGLMPELLSIYHLFGDPGMRIR